MQKKSPKVLVYTAVFGQKDAAPCLVNKGSASENIHFICITDDPLMDSEDYEIRVVRSKFKDSVKNARFYKICGAPTINDFDIAIWHDSSIIMDCSKLEYLIDSGTNILSAFRHGETCTYAEARQALSLQKDNPIRIAFQMMYYGFGLKYPTRNGVFETTVLVKNVAKYQGSSLMKVWWSHVKHMSCRDQFSLPIARWKTKSEIKIIEGRGHDNPYSIYRGHKQPAYKPANFFLRINTPLLRKVGLWVIYRVELSLNSRK